MVIGEGAADIYSYTEPADEVLIAAGVVTVTAGLMVIGAESGTADDLDTLTPSADFAAGYGRVVYLTATIGDTITLKHGTGNLVINTGADAALTEDKVAMLVRFVATTTSKVNAKWKVII